MIIQVNLDENESNMIVKALYSFHTFDTLNTICKRKIIEKIENLLKENKDALH